MIFLPTASSDSIPYSFLCCGRPYVMKCRIDDLNATPTGLAEPLSYASGCSGVLAPQPAPPITKFSTSPCSGRKLESCSYKLRSGCPLPCHPMDGQPRLFWVEKVGVTDATPSRGAFYECKSSEHRRKKQQFEDCTSRAETLDPARRVHNA